MKSWPLARAPEVRRFVAPGVFERLLRAAAERLGRPGAARQNGEVRAAPGIMGKP